AAAMLIDRDPRRRGVWMLLALTLTAVILIGHIADTDQFRSLTDDRPRFVGLCVAATLTVGLLALWFVRRPGVFPLLVVGVLPFRVPIEAAGTTTNLLVPLYLVIAGGCCAFTWRMIREQDRSAREDVARPLSIALGAFLVL